MNVPKLRFPGFEGEWQQDTLGKFVKIWSGVSPSVLHLSGSGDTPFLKVEELNNCEKYQFEGRFYTNDKFNAVPPNSIVFPKRGAAILLNKIRINVVSVIIDTNLMALIPNISIINHEFLFYTLLKENLSKIADTSSIPQLNNKHIEPYLTNFPSLAEQEKIASFLSSVDNVIQLLTKKKTLFENYKKGIMQKIFSQEIRFKDDNGNDFPEWEERRLGEVAKFSKGKGISKNDISPDGKYECVRYGELYTFYRETIDKVKSRTDLNSAELIFSESNDVIIPASGETQIDIATASCVLRAGIALGGDLNIIKSENNGVFLSYYLNNKKKFEIANLAQGISVVHLYSGQLSSLTLSLPTLPEQQKIADFLSGIDKVIDIVNSQMEKAKEYKKGLLQKMFV